MIIDDKIRDKKLKYDINRVAARMLALSSSKIYMNLSISQVKKYCLQKSIG